MNTDESASRDAARRELRALTPEERLRRFVALQTHSMNMLRANPEGFERFMRRNISKRAVEPMHHEG